MLGAFRGAVDVVDDLGTAGPGDKEGDAIVDNGSFGIAAASDVGTFGGTDFSKCA